MTKITIEELKELLRFAWESGKKAGYYQESSSGYLELIGEGEMIRNFENWYKKEIEGKK